MNNVDIEKTLDNQGFFGMEHSGIEPLTFWLPANVELLNTFK
jgi:hypothetical protein